MSPVISGAACVRPLLPSGTRLLRWSIPCVLDHRRQLASPGCVFFRAEGDVTAVDDWQEIIGGRDDGRQGRARLR